MPNKYTGKLEQVPPYVLAWFRSGDTPAVIAEREGRKPNTVRSIMRYWKDRYILDKDCWLRTPHGPHKWHEGEGPSTPDRLTALDRVTLGGAPTVLQPPEVAVFSCAGVPDLVAESSALPRAVRFHQGEYDNYYTLNRYTVGGIEVIRERRISLDAVYERTIRVDSQWTKVQQITCWCCTCPPDYGTDWACRNHGNGFGMRPCDIHGTRGSTIISWRDTEAGEEEYDTGEMPESVMVYRRKHASES